MTTEKITLLNARIDNITMEDLLERKSGTILTVQTDMLVKMQRDRELYELMKKCDVVTCDSQIMVFASKWLGHPFKERVSGSDYLPRFYTKYKDDPSVTIFLLGAAPGIAEVARDKINAKVGRDIVCGVLSPSFGFEDKPEEIEQILTTIVSSNASVLVVGLGAPKQERFIFTYRDRLPNVKLFLPLGGTIDYEAGVDITRPAPWVTDAGLEWAYRLVAQPRKRWKRYLVDQMPFFTLIAQQKRGSYRDPFAAE
jgi:exopolysaccharide biosynthesis WecB/TagA/CpsF family protein